MSEAGYTITTDPATKLVRIRLVGHWPASTANAFGREIYEKYTAMSAHGVRPGQYLTYIDGTQYAVQGQDTVALYESLISNPDILSRKIAFYMPGALARLQAARVAPRDHHRFFPSEAEAIDWLLNESD